MEPHQEYLVLHSAFLRKKYSTNRTINKDCALFGLENQTEL